MRANRSRAALTGLAVLMALACRSAPPPDRSPAAAWVGSDTLDAERLAHWLVLAQPFPLEHGAVIDIARHWQLAAVLAHGSAGIDDAVHAAARAAADDAAIAELRGTRFADPLPQARAQAASTYAAGELRLIAHVLRRVDPQSAPDERTIQRRAAESILRDLRNGLAWSEANRRNEDDAARAAGGVIGLVARTELPPPLDSIAFTLEPGSFSDVVETAAGFHVLHRPALADVSEDFANRLAERIAEAQERELAGEVAVRRNAGLAPVAPLRVAEIAPNPWAALATTDPVGSFDGGTLTGGDIAAALVALSWDARRALLEAPAAAREAFAGRALIRKALRTEARDAGFMGDTVMFARQHATQLDSIARHLVVRADDPRLAVDRYMGRIAARHVTMITPHAAVWSTLFAGVDAGLRADAIQVAIDRARVLLRAADDPQ